MKNAVKVSLIAHLCFALGLVGCALHKPVVRRSTDTAVAAATTQILYIEKQLPLWEADTLSRFEQAELAIVKADLVKCGAATTRQEYLAMAAKLQEDWDALVSLDSSLTIRHLI